MRKFSHILSVLLYAAILSSCSSNPPDNYAGRIMVLSVSSDGRYVISSDFSQHVVLWNIPKRTYKVIASKANIYSAYFIKHTDYFIYQSNRNNDVYVKNTDEETIKKIKPGFASYGEIMTPDLKSYFGSDVDFNVYKLGDNKKMPVNVSYCRQDYNGKHYSGKATSACVFFASAGKLLNFTLSKNNTQLVGSGFGRLYIWNIKTGRGKIYQKNDAQTYATISPDGKYVVSGDGAMRGYLYDMITGKGKRFFYQTPKTKNTKWYYTNGYQNSVINVITLKFVDKNHIIMIGNGVPQAFNYAILYDINDIHKMKHYYKGWIENELVPIKYLALLVKNKPNQPYPATQDFVRDQAIDTSPSAHILVMAQAQNNGILVYKYNPKTQTLKQIWAPVIR